MFNGLLLSMLDLMSSEYGFVGEMMYEADGTMYLLSHAITNIAWNAETRELYEQNSATGLRFQSFDNLFGSVVTSKEVVISNNPREDPRAKGVPRKYRSQRSVSPAAQKGCRIAHRSALFVL